MDPLDALTEALRLVRRANAGLTAHRCSRPEWERRLACFVEIEKLAGFGKATAAARVADVDGLAGMCGSSLGRAREVITTGRALAGSPALSEAVAEGRVSLDQASEIARTAVVAPDSVDELVEVARTESFRALRDRARRVRLDAEDPDDLRRRRHRARRVRHWIGDLGMVHLDAVLEPHVGAPIVARLEHAGRRRAAAARRSGSEGARFEQHLADAFAEMHTRPGAGPEPRRSSADVVVLVSHEITRRGWTRVAGGEICAIPGMGPIHPDTAREIAEDAFLSGVFFDGTDLRHIKRWTRSVPPEVRLALRLGPPPEFDGPRCIDCGRRLQLEVDHREPFAAGGPTSLGNSDLRCPSCHDAKTRADLETIRRTRRSQPSRNARQRQTALMPQPP